VALFAVGVHGSIGFLINNHTLVCYRGLYQHPARSPPSARPRSPPFLLPAARSPAPYLSTPLFLPLPTH
jgi:hypothetical protein